MRILIAIHGSHVLAERMQAQRETWIPQVSRVAMPPSWSLDYRWFVERPYIADDVYMLPWDPEPLWFQDGPVARRTSSTNMKTRALVEFALLKGYDYVFKCDDDTYVRPRLLIKSGFEKHDYSGSTEMHHADDTGYYQYAGGGGGYWLSRRAMVAVFTGNEPHKYRHGACDVTVGQTLAAAGIFPYHNSRYLNAVTDTQISRPPSYAITLHKCDPDQMRIVHQALNGQ